MFITLLQVSNHVISWKLWKVAEIKTLSCHMYKVISLSKSRVCNFSNKNLIRVLWPLTTCPAYIFTLLHGLNHYLENYRSCRDINPIMPCVYDKFSLVNQGYVTLPIIIWSESFDLYAHAKCISLLWCKFQTITLKIVGGVAETRTVQ